MLLQQARDSVHAYNDKRVVDYLLESAVLCFLKCQTY
jgi:hypothetical protein